jgi:hypothetical protein
MKEIQLKGEGSSIDITIKGSDNAILPLYHTWVPRLMKITVLKYRDLIRQLTKPIFFTPDQYTLENVKKMFLKEKSKLVNVHAFKLIFLQKRKFC